MMTRRVTTSRPLHSKYVFIVFRFSCPSVARHVKLWIVHESCAHRCTYGRNRIVRTVVLYTKCLWSGFTAVFAGYDDFGVFFKWHSCSLLSPPHPYHTNTTLIIIPLTSWRKPQVHARARNNDSLRNRTATDRLHHITLQKLFGKLYYIGMRTYN